MNKLKKAFAVACLVWGLFGGWAMLGVKWPQLNVVTKDSVFILFALAVLYKTEQTK